jgi:hypothetical protein
MGTGGEIILRRSANALLPPLKSANPCGNLGCGVCIVAFAQCSFGIPEKLNQAHLVVPRPGSPFIDRGWKRENDTS